MQAPYQKCTAMFLWTSLPSFSKSTQREHSIITVEKRDIRRSTQNIIALVKPLLFSNLRVGQKKMHSFGGRPRERIQILLWFIQSSLLSKLWVRCFWLGDLDIQIFSSYGDRSQISQMKVTDGWGTVCCHHSAKKRGLLGFKLFAFLRLVPYWIRGVSSFHSMKSTAGFSF